MAINDRTRTRENVVAILKRKPPIIRRKIVGWKAWYDDGRVFSSSKDKWQDLPSVGLTVLKKFYYQYKSDNDDDGFVKDAHGKEHLKIERQSGPDVYCLENEMLDDSLPNYIKAGVWIDENIYQDLFNKAGEDTEIITIRV